MTENEETAQADPTPSAASQQEDIASPVSPAGANYAKFIRPAVSLLVLVVCVMLVSRLFSGDKLSSVRKYLTDDIESIAYFDIEKMTKSRIAKKLDLDPEELIEELELDIDEDDISKVIAVEDEDVGQYFLMILKKGIKDVEDVIDGKADADKYKKVEIATSRSCGLSVAKLKNKLLAVAEDEKIIKDIIKNIGKAPKFEKEFRQLIKQVDNYDSFIVGSGGIEDAEFMGIGLTTKKKLSVEMVLIYDDKDDAKDALEEIEDQDHEMLEKMKFKVSGSKLTGRGTFDEDDVEDDASPAPFIYTLF